MMCFLPRNKVHCLTVRKLRFELASPPDFGNIVATDRRLHSEFAFILPLGYFLDMLPFHLNSHFLLLKEGSPKHITELVVSKAPSCEKATLDTHFDSSVCVQKR